jgi:hypothetical protein
LSDDLEGAMARASHWKRGSADPAGPLGYIIGTLTIRATVATPFGRSFPAQPRVDDLCALDLQCRPLDIGIAFAVGCL